MKVEKRRYKIKGFRDDGSKIRVLLEPAEIVQQSKKIGFMEITKNPMGIANQMMNQQMHKMINDSFSITREEYQKNKYMVGELVTVTIERENIN